jgi:hypothetical protein
MTSIVEQLVISLYEKGLLTVDAGGMQELLEEYKEIEKKQRIKNNLEWVGSMAKRREQARETAMHIGFAKGFDCALKCQEDFYKGLEETDLSEDEFMRNYIVDEFEKAYKEGEQC